MKKAFLLTIMLGYGMHLLAQSEKASIAIFPFVAAVPENKGRAAQIQDMVIEILRAKSNIELVDRSKDSLLMKELDMQIREQSMSSGSLAQQGKVMGARHMIVGTLSNVQVEQSSSSVDRGMNLLTKKQTGVGSSIEYKANISFSLQLSDVETGKIISQKAINTSQGSGGLLNILKFEINSANSKEEAILNAIKATRKQILAWINESFPPEIKILTIEERDKKGFPETVLVTGIDGTLQKGSQLSINEIEILDAGGGKSLRRCRKIVDLKVKEIQGDITVCKVTGGEKILEEKMKSGARMECIIDK